MRMGCHPRVWKDEMLNCWIHLLLAGLHAHSVLRAHTDLLTYTIYMVLTMVAYDVGVKPLGVGSGG